MKQETALKEGVHFDLDNNTFAEKTGWISKEDGKEYIVGEYILARDTINTIQKEEIEILQELKKYPEIGSIGNLYSLRQIMSKDKTGKLKELVDNLIQNLSRA